MSSTQNDKQENKKRQATIQELLQERMRLAIRHTLVTILEEEASSSTQHFTNGRQSGEITSIGATCAIW